jgi:hypothetical protein
MNTIKHVKVSDPAYGSQPLDGICPRCDGPLMVGSWYCPSCEETRAGNDGGEPQVAATKPNIPVITPMEKYWMNRSFDLSLIIQNGLWELGVEDAEPKALSGEIQALKCDNARLKAKEVSATNHAIEIESDLRSAKKLLGSAWTALCKDDSRCELVRDIDVFLNYLDYRAGHEN